MGLEPLDPGHLLFAEILKRESAEAGKRGVDFLGQQQGHFQIQALVDQERHGVLGGKSAKRAQYLLAQPTVAAVIAVTAAVFDKNFDAGVVPELGQGPHGGDAHVNGFLGGGQQQFQVRPRIGQVDLPQRPGRLGARQRIGILEHPELDGGVRFDVKPIAQQAQVAVDRVDLAADGGAGGFEPGGVVKPEQRLGGGVADLFLAIPQQGQDVGGGVDILEPCQSQGRAGAHAGEAVLGKRLPELGKGHAAVGLQKNESLVAKSGVGVGDVADGVFDFPLDPGAVLLGLVDDFGDDVGGSAASPQLDDAGGAGVEGGGAALDHLENDGRLDAGLHQGDDLGIGEHFAGLDRGFARGRGSQSGQEQQTFEPRPTMRTTHGRDILR